MCKIDESAVNRAVLELKLRPTDKLRPFHSCKELPTLLGTQCHKHGLHQILILTNDGMVKDLLGVISKKQFLQQTKKVPKKLRKRQTTSTANLQILLDLLICLIVPGNKAIVKNLKKQELYLPALQVLVQHFQSESEIHEAQGLVACQTSQYCVRELLVSGVNYSAVLQLPYCLQILGYEGGVCTVTALRPALGGMLKLVAKRLRALHQKLLNFNQQDLLTHDWLMNELWLLGRCAFMLVWDKSVLASDQVLTSGLLPSVCLVAELSVVDSHPELRKVICSFFDIVSMSGPSKKGLQQQESSLGIVPGKLSTQTDMSDTTILAIAKTTKIQDKSENLAFRYYTTCGWCSLLCEDTFKKCGACRLVYYCSTECQRADWQQHKSNCRNYKN